MFVLGLKLGYTAKYGLNPQDFHWASPFGKSLELRPYSAYPFSRPNTDTIYFCDQWTVVVVASDFNMPFKTFLLGVMTHILDFVQHRLFREQL